MSTAYLGGRRDIKLLFFPKSLILCQLDSWLRVQLRIYYLQERGRPCHPPRAKRGCHPPRARRGGGHHGTQNTISYVNGEQHLSSLSVPGWSQNNTNAMFLQEGKFCKSQSWNQSIRRVHMPCPCSSEISAKIGSHQQQRSCL